MRCRHLDTSLRLAQAHAEYDDTGFLVAYTDGVQDSERQPGLQAAREQVRWAGAGWRRCMSCTTDSAVGPRAPLGCCSRLLASLWDFCCWPCVPCLQLQHYRNALGQKIGRLRQEVERMDYVAGAWHRGLLVALDCGSASASNLRHGTSV